jgi:hypothetical protein
MRVEGHFVSPCQNAPCQGLEFGAAPCAEGGVNILGVGDQTVQMVIESEEQSKLSAPAMRLDASGFCVVEMDEDSVAKLLGKVGLIVIDEQAGNDFPGAGGNYVGFAIIDSESEGR